MSSEEEDSASEFSSVPEGPDRDPHKHFVSDPKHKIESLFEKFEMMALRQGAGNVDLHSFSEEQKDKLLTIVEQNEGHAFEYFKEQLKTKKELGLAKINAGNFTFKTNRIVLVILILALFIVTVLILLHKEDFFFQWLTFLTGLIGGSVGGYGIGRASREGKKKAEAKED